MGGVGGLVHSIHYHAGMQLPHWGDRHFKPGVLGDIIIGMAAGVVIFLLVPGELSIEGNDVSLTDLIKSFGFALVGGYGGPLVLEKALGSTIAEMKETITKNQSDILQHEEQREIDRNAMMLVDRQLSDTSQAVIPESELLEAINKASAVTQHYIRQQASDKRRQAWQRKKQDPQHRSTGLTERTIPIFRALVDVPGRERNDRRLSQLAYALKDQDVPDWKGALEFISRAINSLDEGRLIPHHYYYTWALAAIHEPEAANAVTEEGVKKVEQRLRASLDFEPLREGFQEELKGEYGAVIKSWLKEHGIDFSDLGVEL
jgi:hypothetical protein